MGPKIWIDYCITFFSNFDLNYQKISLEIDPTKIQESKTGNEFQLAAKHYLNYWNSLNKTEKESKEEIVSTSVEYSVLTPKTAIFGFIKNKSKPTQEMQTVECKVKKFIEKKRNKRSSSSSSDSSESSNNRRNKNKSKNLSKYIYEQQMNTFIYKIDTIELSSWNLKVILNAPSNNYFRFFKK